MGARRPGRENIEANAMLYNALHPGVTLADARGRQRRTPPPGHRAGTLRTASNATLWDAAAGYIGTTRRAPAALRTATRSPSGTASPPPRRSSVSNAALTRWNITARSPRRKPTTASAATSHLPGSMELAAHLAAGDNAGAGPDAPGVGLHAQLPAGPAARSGGLPVRTGQFG